MAKISIITINLNQKPGLAKTIRSVAGQTFTPFEFIIVDGNSSDGSLQLIQEHQSDISHFISERDNGIYDAMNKGISLAKGDYLLFLNAGDQLADKNVLKDLTGMLDDVDILYGDLITVDASGQQVFHQAFDEASVHNFMISTIWHPCALIKKHLFEKYGNYLSSFKIAGDYEFFVRTILANGAKSRRVKRYVAMFDTGGVSGKEENRGLMDEERKRAWTLNFSDPMIRFFEQAVILSRSRELQIGKLVSRFLPG